MKHIIIQKRLIVAVAGIKTLTLHLNGKKLLFFNKYGVAIHITNARMGIENNTLDFPFPSTPNVLK